MEKLTRIASFSVNHDNLPEGIYLSRTDGNVFTYDLRTRVPNAGNYMDNLTMHSVEHLFATYVRSSELADKVIYFGPMGCQTGFYLLVRDTTHEDVLRVVKAVLKSILSHTGEMPGGRREECGNYKNLSVEAAKAECERYLEVLNNGEWDMSYPGGNNA